MTHNRNPLNTREAEFKGDKCAGKVWYMPGVVEADRIEAFRSAQGVEVYGSHVGREY